MHTQISMLVMSHGLPDYALLGHSDFSLHRPTAVKLLSRYSVDLAWF